MAKILIVEDNLTTLHTCALLLRSEGYEVGTAASGREGLDRLAEAPYDLVLADLSLGDMTAITLLDRMAQAGLAAPVVVIAGLGTIDSAVEAMRRGAVDYAVKPLIGDDFLERVERGLTHAAAKRTRRFEPHAHAAARWADAVVALTESHTDVRTIGQWARAVGASASTVRAWCQRANVSPRRSLVLARLLRAVHHSEGRPWQPAQRLHVTDSRTLAGMLAAGGLSTSADRVTIAQLLDGQTLIEDPETLVEFRRRLERPDRAPISS